MNFEALVKPIFQFDINSQNKAQACVYVLASNSEQKRIAEYNKIVNLEALDSDKKKLLAESKKTVHFQAKNGHVWILQPMVAKNDQHGGLLETSSYSWFRDQIGGVYSQFKNLNIETVNLVFSEATTNVQRACVIGLELSAYNFTHIYKKSEQKSIKINLNSTSKSKIFKVDKNKISAAQQEAVSVQLARHLVNLPPNLINPKTIEDVVLNQLGFSKSTKIEVWNGKKLKAENLNLLLAVGQGAVEEPRLIHIKYRPTKKTKRKPIAFVGKGITFDTGGLDIKPSSAMRLMKKDMGGAAAVLALAYWVSQSGYKRACDFYLALAENSVDAKAMRPSDLYKSRAGYVVEIDNTDAEGRLVLADAMDVAIKQKKDDEPEILIDIATLTGAIKVALGADIAGLFCNDDKLADQLLKSGQAAGEPSWRMPLVSKYFASLNSHFADFKNSADGFGGAITAALFLEKFCGNKKWAHLDIYSWNDKPNGALSGVGGSGQPVQSIIEWLKRVET